MKASKRLKQSLAALEQRLRMPVQCPPLEACEFCRVVPCRVIPAQPSPLARKLAVERILAKLRDADTTPSARPPGCKRRGGKWVPR